MEYAFRNTLTRILLVLGVLGLLASVVWAQGGSGELQGLVTDPSGAVVANAQVTLTNAATGDKRTTATTNAGIYRFAALPVVGTYTLELSPKGFKSAKIANIVVSVGTVINQDVHLELGAASEQVTVEAGVQQVQTTESSISDLLNRRVWQSMPLETRSQNEFMGLLAGVEPAAQAQLPTDRGPAVNGTRSGTGNFMVEGYDNNDQGLGGAPNTSGPGGANTTISPDAIQEYRVIEHIPPAEYGKAGGFVTDTVLKSGTNQWHGSLFEYNRIQALAANSWFSNHSGQQDQLVRNQFGGSVGGPVVKDKTFFFFSTEFHRERTANPLTAQTMTSDFVDFVNSGEFETFQETDPTGFCNAFFDASCPGAFADASTLGPIFTKMQALQNVPLCTRGQANCSNFTAAAQGLYTGLFLGQVYPVDTYAQITVPQTAPLNQTRYTAKVDHKLTSKDQLSGTFLYDNGDQTIGFGGNNVLGPDLPFHARGMNGGVTWTHTLSPTILNQARFSYTRHTSNFPGDPKVAGFPSVLTFFDSPTFGYGNASNLPQFFTEQEFNWKDDVSVTKGKHNFKAGGSFTRTRNASDFSALINGYFFATDVEDLLTDGKFTDIADNLYFGYPYYGGFVIAEASINPTTNQRPNGVRGFRANEAAAYLQDDWRVTNRLTLNLGLRWEYFGPPHNNVPNIDANFYTGSTATPIICNFVGGPAPCNDTEAGGNLFFPVNSPFYAGMATGVSQVRNHNIWNKDLNNWGPRLGFAYDVMGNQKVVVRGGYGINYDRMYNNIFENIRFNPPFFAFALTGAFGSGVPAGGLATPGLYTAPFTSTALFGGSGLTPSLRAVDDGLVTAYYEQANFGVQYQLGKDMVLETNYVGTFGHKLLSVLGENTYDGRYNGINNVRINPAYSNISFRTNCCSSNYHALQTSLRKRFTSGLQFNVNYTYSKALDEISDTFSTKNASVNAYPTDSQNPAFDYGPADFNTKHRIVGSFSYELPFAKTNRWIGGWGLSGILSAQSGTPFNITNSGIDSNADGQFNDRATYIGPGSITNAINHHQSPATGYLDVTQWVMPNSSDLPCPANVNQGLWCQGSVVGQMQRNSLTGPKYFDADFGVSKRFKITESAAIQLQANFFNIFNHPNFFLPANNLNSPSSFGQSQATFAPGPGGARVTQLAVRFDF